MQTRRVSGWILLSVGIFSGILIGRLPSLFQIDFPSGTPPQIDASDLAPTVGALPHGTPRPLAGHRLTPDELEAEVLHILRYSSPESVIPDLNRLAQSIPSSDIPGVVRLFLTRPEPKLGEGLLLPLFGRWAGTDPLAAVDCSLSLPVSVIRTRLLSTVFSEWATVAPADAMEWAVKLPPGTSRTSIMLSAIEGCAKNSPQDALDFLDRFDSDADRRNAEAAILRRWAEQDPEGAIAAANDLPNKSMLLAQIAYEWARRDPHAAILWVSGSSDTAGDPKTVHLLCHALAETNPDLCGQFALSLADGTGRADAIGTAALALAQQDLSKAIALINQAPDEASRVSALLLIGGTWAEVDPEAALEAASSIATEHWRSTFLRDCLTRWARSNPKQAAAWALHLPQEDPHLLSSVISEWTQHSPVQAATFVAAELREDSQLRAVSTVLEAWTGADPIAALSWVNMFPEGELRNQGYASLIATWARTDGNGVTHWLETLPSGVERDRAIGDYVRVMREREPRSAIAWAERIDDQDARLRSAENVAATWLIRAPAEARHWIEDSWLPAESKARFSGIDGSP